MAISSWLGGQSRSPRFASLSVEGEPSNEPEHRKLCDKRSRLCIAPHARTFVVAKSGAQYFSCSPRYPTLHLDAGVGDEPASWTAHRPKPELLPVQWQPRTSSLTPPPVGLVAHAECRSLRHSRWLSCYTSISPRVRYLLEGVNHGKSRQTEHCKQIAVESNGWIATAQRWWPGRKQCW